MVVFAVILVLSLPLAAVFIPLTLLTGNAGPLYAVGCWVARVALRVAGVRLRFAGRENIPPDRACIFMANHVSNLDPPALISSLPGRTSVFLKRSLMKLPILGYAFKIGGFIPVNRDGRPESAKESVAQACRILAQGLHITMFVEGKRSHDGRLLPFKKGPFYLAKDSGALCVPVSIYGTEKIIPRGSSRIYPGVAHIVFHPPVDPAAYATREDLMHAVRESIASALPEWMRNRPALPALPHEPLTTDH